MKHRKSLILSKYQCVFNNWRINGEEKKYLILSKVNKKYNKISRKIQGN
jgi:hypothetical protein